MKVLDYLSSEKRPWFKSQHVVHLKKYVTIFSAIFLSIILSGKGRCFGVVMAHLQNKTCQSATHTCSISFLNFIGDLSVAIALAGSPFVTGFLIRFKTPALGGRISVQCAIIILLGCLATNFTTQPDTLIVTDALIQGIGTSVIASIIATRLTELFPRENKYHVLVSAFTDAGPWGTVIMCPLFGVILQTTHWQQVYLFFAVLLVLAVLIVSIVEPTNYDQPMMSIYKVEDVDMPGPSSKCPDHPDQQCTSYEEVNEIEFSDNEPSVYSLSSDENSEEPIAIQHVENIPPAPEAKSFFFNPETRNVLREGTSILWLVERAIHTMVLYNVVLNLVDYMVVEIQESLEKASLIMMSFGGGEVIGFIISVGVGDQLRHHLLHIYTIATALLTIIFMGWHITQAIHINSLANGDAHFLALVCGIVMAFTSGYTYALAEDVLSRPGIIAYPLTRFFQALGLIFAPLTSGVVIQFDRYKSFFLIQTVLTFIRFGLLSLLIYRLRQRKKVHDNLCQAK